MEYWHFQKTGGLTRYEAMLELFAHELIEQLHGTPLWLAWVQGIPLPAAERRMFERIAR